MAASECAPLDFGCKAGEWANSVVGDAIQNMADAVMEAFGKAVASLGTLFVTLQSADRLGSLHAATCILGLQGLVALGIALGSRRLARTAG